MVGELQFHEARTASGTSGGARTSESGVGNTVQVTLGSGTIEVVAVLGVWYHTT